MSEEESGDDDSQVSDSQLVCVLDAKNRLIFPAFLPYHCLLYKFLYIRGPNIRKMYSQSSKNGLLLLKALLLQ